MVKITLKDQFEDEENLKIIQYLLYIFNTIFLIAGSIIFAIGIYVMFESSMGDYIGGLEMDFYYNGTAVLIFGSSLVVMNSFLGICGAFFTNRKSLIVYQVFSCITFVILLSASAYLLANGLEQSNLYPYIQESMRALIYEYEKDIAAKTSVNTIQENIGCCGGYGSSDYTDIHLPIPDTCRDHITGNQYGDSCAEVLSWFIEKRTGWICGLSLCLCFLQLFAVILSLYANVFIGKIKKRS